MMENDDELAFVSPGRREEVRRRLAAIRRYIANPCKEEADRAIAALGMGKSNFHLLVQTFRRTGDPTTIAGATREKTKAPRLADDFRLFADRIIEGAGDLDERELTKRITAEATLRGVTLPHVHTLRRYVRNKSNQRADQRLTLGAEFAIDICVIKLPVFRADGVIGSPAAALVIDLVSRRLAGLALTLSPPDATLVARALRSSLAPLSGSANPPTIVVSLAPAVLDELEHQGALQGLDVRTRPFVHGDQGIIAAAELQQRIGGLKIQRRKAWHRFEDRKILVPPKERALSLAEAEAFILAREQHLRGTSAIALEPALLSELRNNLVQFLTTAEAQAEAN